jgi:ribosomal protein L7Ae-like RNA K-turn-binding protein
MHSMMFSNVLSCMADLPETYENAQKLLTGILLFVCAVWKLIQYFSCQAHLAVLAESCDSEPCTKLIVTLCAEHNINLIKIEDGKKLSEWARFCVLDREGNV